MSGSDETVPPMAAGSPPIAVLLPLVHLVLDLLSLLLRLGIRLFLALAYPLHVLGTIFFNLLLAPMLVAVEIAFSTVFLVPYSIIRMTVVTLYPVYVFCFIACITGVLLGSIGRYVATTILASLVQTKYFTPPQPPAPPPPPAPSLRKQKRKSVRLS